MIKAWFEIYPWEDLLLSDGKCDLTVYLGEIVEGVRNSMAYVCKVKVYDVVKWKTLKY